jgi:hypothetical protein
MDMARFPSDRNPEPKAVTASPKIMQDKIEIITRFFFITAPFVENFFGNRTGLFCHI